MFIKRPQNYWNDKETQKNFLKEVAVKLRIKQPKDWGFQTRAIINSFGGSGLLAHHNYSLYSALCNLFPGITYLGMFKCLMFCGGKSGFQDCVQILL